MRRRTAPARSRIPAPPSTPTRAERVLVFGGLTTALVATPVLVALGLGMEAVQALWLLAVLWTVGAQLGCVLWRGVRHGDWSGFRHPPPPEDNDTREWSERTGRYAFLREDDAARRRGDDSFI